MKTLFLSAVAFVAASSATFANTPAICAATNNTAPGCPISSVPEISALEGTAALAAVAAIVLLAWERRSRA